MPEVIVSLVVTMFNTNIQQIKNWVFILNSFKNRDDVQILFMSDDPIISEEQKKTIKDNGYQFIDSTFNKSKTILLKEGVDDNIIIGKYIKVLDPDDYLDVKEMEKTISIIKSTPGYAIFITSINEYYLGGKTIEYSDLPKYKNEKFHLPEPVNRNVFYIKDDIKFFSFNMRFTRFDDIFLTILSMFRDRKVINLNTYPYISNFRAGLSNNWRKDKISLNRGYQEAFNFFTQLNKIQKDNNVTHYYNFNFWHIGHVINLLKSTNDLSKLKIIKLYNKIAKEMKPQYNKYFNLIFTLSIYWKILFWRKPL